MAFSHPFKEESVSFAFCFLIPNGRSTLHFRHFLKWLISLASCYSCSIPVFATYYPCPCNSCIIHVCATHVLSMSVQLMYYPCFCNSCIIHVFAARVLSMSVQLMYYLCLCNLCIIHVCATPALSMSMQLLYYPCLCKTLCQHAAVMVARVKSYMDVDYIFLMGYNVVTE